MDLSRIGLHGPTPPLTARAVVLLALGAGACVWTPPAGDDPGAVASASVWGGDAARPATDATIGNGRPAKVADAGIFGSVVAAGVGCPTGTWGMVANARGDALEVMFTALAIELGDGITTAQTSCTLNLKLSRPKAASFALSGARWEGAASLGRGVTASESVRASVLGDPGSRAAVVGEQVGPYDDGFVLQQDVPEADRKWSRCLTSADLSIQIDLRLLRTVASAAGSVYFRKLLAIDLATRACDG